MSGSKEGARKASLTNKKKYGESYYKDIGAKSWKNPERSHETGFALLPQEERKRLGAFGGSKNKGKTYVKKNKEEFLTAEELHTLTQDQPEDSPSPSQ